jgi:hypothetical protein
MSNVNKLRIQNALDSVVTKSKAVLESERENRIRMEPLNVNHLIRVLRAYPAGRRSWAVMQSIRRDRKKAGLPIPHNFEDGVERAFEEHCVDSDSFKRRKQPPEAALFHRPLSKAGGVWAVYPDRAEAWLAGRL